MTRTGTADEAGANPACATLWWHAATLLGVASTLSIAMTASLAMDACARLVDRGAALR